MAQDMFLKLDGIKGESMDSKHKDEIDVLSFSWGESNAAAGAHLGGGGAGKVSVQDFSFTARVNKASPILFLSCATGKHIKDGLISVRKAGESAGNARGDFLTYKMTDVIISSYQISGNTQEIPTDSFSLNFTQLDVTFLPQKADGTFDAPVMASFNFLEHK